MNDKRNQYERPIDIQLPSKQQEQVMKKPLEILSLDDPDTDPNGMWTGIPENPYEKPVQDADDL